MQAVNPLSPDTAKKQLFLMHVYEFSDWPDCLACLKKKSKNALPPKAYRLGIEGGKRKTFLPFLLFLVLFATNPSMSAIFTISKMLSFFFSSVDF